MNFNLIVISILAIGSASANGQTPAYAATVTNPALLRKSAEPTPPPQVMSPPAIIPTLPPSATPASANPSSTAVVEPVAPPKPEYPKCNRKFEGTSKLADVKAMMKDLLGTDITNKLWLEARPKFGGQSKLRVVATDPIQIELFSGDGTSLGVTRLDVCAQGGTIVAAIKVKGIKFPFGTENMALTALQTAQGRSDVMIYDISKAAKGNIHVGDRLTGNYRVDSDFVLSGQTSR